MVSVHRDYTAPAKWLHWLMALLIVGAAIIGVVGTSIDRSIDTAHAALRANLVNAHKSIATLTIFLIVLRILWRLTHRPPSLSGLSPLMARAAHLGHFALYLLMIAVPLSGWANSSAAGFAIPVAGLFTLPPLMDKTPALALALSSLHEVLAYGLVALVAGHVAFALKHHVLDGDDILRSMLPRRR
jgi:cytochrome b561